MAGSPVSGKMCLPPFKFKGFYTKNLQGAGVDECWESYSEMGLPHLPALDYQTDTLKLDA